MIATNDINRDGCINISDLLAIINSWDQCGMPPGEHPESVEDCESSCADLYPGGGQDYADCVEDCVLALCKAGTLPPEDCPEEE